MTTNNTRILIVGNFLSARLGTRSIGEDLRDQLEGNGWKVIWTSAHQNRLLRMLDMLFTTWRCRNQYYVATIDVYSGLSFWWAYTVAQLLKVLRKPYILNLQGGKLPEFAKRYPIQIHSVLQSATGVVTTSNYLCTQFEKIRPDIRLFPNGIDLKGYRFIHRQSFAPRLAWLRAFHAIYNPSLAAETLALLVAEFPDIELTMFGPDKGDGSRGAMEAWAKSANVAHRIHTPGPIPKSEVPSALAPYDIFLNTTTAESFGVSVMEAAALGMCIVTTNVGELPYIWTHEHDALLVPPNDSDAMANAVRRILTEPGLAERLSRNARAKAEQFDWAVVLPQWERLLADVAQQRKA